MSLAEATRDVVQARIERAHQGIGLVRSQHHGRASFLAVVTSGGFARRRADGVYALPIGLLGP